MSVITAVPIAEALPRPSRKQPSARTLRRHHLEQDATELAGAIDHSGAALISVTEGDLPSERYLSGLRRALRRLGYGHILLQKRPGRDELAAWRKRPEDRERIDARRRRTARVSARSHFR